MGFEGYFVLGATVLLIAFVIPALSKRREILANAPLEDRYSEDLRMLKVSDAPGADRPNDDGQRGSVFFKRPEVDMAGGRVTKDVRELARDRARVRARMSKRAAGLQRGFFGGALVAALAVLLWAGVAVGFASPLLAGIATAASLAYGAGFVYVYRKAAEADVADREELADIVAQIGPRRAQGRKVAADAARRSAKKKADVEARASLAQAARGARVEVRESDGARAAARRAAARKAAAQKAAATARIEGELCRRFERSKAASRISDAAGTGGKAGAGGQAFDEGNGVAGVSGKSGRFRGRKSGVGASGKSSFGVGTYGDGRSAADEAAGRGGSDASGAPRGGARKGVASNAGLRAGSGTGFSSASSKGSSASNGLLRDSHTGGSSRSARGGAAVRGNLSPAARGAGGVVGNAPAVGDASGGGNTSAVGIGAGASSRRAEMPSYTLKPGSVDRKVVKPYAAPASATAPVPYRPQVIGERYDVATGVVMPSAPGEVPLSPAEAREAQAKVERAVEASVVSHSSEVLSGGSVLDALLERRRA